MIHRLATCLSICVFWVTCGCAWTAILAAINSQTMTILDKCNAPSGLCGFWLIIGGFIISSVAILIFLIIGIRKQVRRSEKQKNDGYSG